MIQDDVEFCDLGLKLIADVNSIALVCKTKRNPIPSAEENLARRLALWSATPIPRTLALILCGDSGSSAMEIAAGQPSAC
ncbi:MAG: hypothetical protein ACLSG9_10115 [Eubacterium sp.]